MNGTLALVGGGEWSEGCVFDAHLLDLSGADEVVVLPTGAAYENPGHLVDRAVAWFGNAGTPVKAVSVLRRPDASDPEMVDVVRAARFVYLAGGSAMHIRSVLKDTPLFGALEGMWRDGGVLAGTSAGADVLCDPMVDSRGGAFTVGLGVVSNLAVIPRSDTWSRDKIHRTVELAPAGLALAAVPERTALLRAPDGAWRVEGAGEVTVWIDGRHVGLDDLPS